MRIRPAATLALASAILITSLPTASARPNPTPGNSPPRPSAAQAETSTGNAVDVDKVSAKLRDYPARKDVVRAVKNGQEGVDFSRPASDGAYWQSKWAEAEKAYGSPDQGLNPGPEASKAWIRDVFVPWLRLQGRDAQADLAERKVQHNDYDAAVMRMMHLGLAYEHIGTPYAWGGGTVNGPSVGSHDLAPLDDDAMRNKDWTRAGFDCGRLINHLLWVGAGIKTSPGTDNLLADITKPGVGEDLGTDLSKARIGDIIFYGTPTRHVGMVAEYSPGDLDKLRIVEAAPVDRGNAVKLNKVPTDEVTHIVRLTALGKSSIGM